MADQTLASLTSATPATGGLIYGTQGGADRKFTLSAAGAALMEAADPATAGGLWQALPMSDVSLVDGVPVQCAVMVVPIQFVCRKLICALPFNSTPLSDGDVSFNAELQIQSFSGSYEVMVSAVELTLQASEYMASVDFPDAILAPGRSHQFVFSGSPYMGSITVTPWLIGTWSNDL